MQYIFKTSLLCLFLTVAFTSYSKGMWQENEKAADDNSTFKIEVTFVDNLISYTCEELIAQDDHWSMIVGNWDEECKFSNTFEIDINKLPFLFTTGDYSIAVNKLGNISVSYLYGDDDFTSQSTLKMSNILEMVRDQSLPDLELALEGADNSSFDVSGTVKISLK